MRTIARLLAYPAAILAGTLALFLVLGLSNVPYDVIITRIHG